MPRNTDSAADTVADGSSPGNHIVKTRRGQWPVVVGTHLTAIEKIGIERAQESDTTRTTRLLTERNRTAELAAESVPSETVGAYHTPQLPPVGFVTS